MEITEGVISEIITRYDRELDRYLKLASRISDICRTDIIEANAIRAQITWRTKSTKSFEAKLRRFGKDKKKNFDNIDDVFKKISDLAGVRIATYRLEDVDRVCGEIKKHFEVIDEQKHNKQDSYKATHCQTALRSDDLVGTYENLRETTCEVQICSMMAHVWNEIEHDIGYKPQVGEPQAAERGLLRSLNHLTQSGDDIIAQLIATNEARLKEEAGDFEDVYDFVARLRKINPTTDFSGNAGQLFDEIIKLNLTSLDKVRNAIKEFDLQQADKKISEFNDYLRKRGEEEYLLDVNSSDSILIFLLEEFAQNIIDNHPVGRGMGRPPRIRSIAARFVEYLKEK